MKLINKFVKSFLVLMIAFILMHGMRHGFDFGALSGHIDSFVYYSGILSLVLMFKKSMKKHKKVSHVHVTG